MTDQFGSSPEPGFSVIVACPTELHLRGELDLATAPVLCSALQPLARPGCTIELDVSQLDFMDAAGIRALRAAAENVGATGRIVLVQPNPMVRRVLEVVDTASFVDIADRPAAGCGGRRVVGG